MELEQKHNSSRRYAVFLSYRHADNKEAGRQWATWLHHLLEGYEIPADLVGKRNSKDDLIPASLYPVFRDEEELPADADLTRNIRQALENSDLLVVLCSPRAVESRFVADEIRYFKELGKSNRILALMIDGEPNAADDPGKAKLGIKPEAECLPEPLRYGVAGNDGKIDWSQRTEPIAADVRPDGNAEQGWTTGAAYREALQKSGKLRVKEIAQKVHAYEQQLELAKLKVVAGSLGVPLGELTRRDKAMQLDKAKKRARTLKLWLAAVGMLALIALMAGFFAVVKAKSERRQRELVQQRETEQRRLLHEASMSDYSVAVKLIDKDEKWQEGVAHLARALDWEPQNALVAARLFQTIVDHAPEYLIRLRVVLPHKAVVSTAAFSPDGSSILTTSMDDSAQLWNTVTGKPIGKPMRQQSAFASKATFSPDGSRIVTAIKETVIQIWDAKTAQPVGGSLTNGQYSFHPTFSYDGAKLVTANDENTARIWDTATGKPLGKLLKHESKLNSAMFSLDGTKIVTTSDDTSVRVWDAATGKPLGEPLQHESAVNTAMFSPDGNKIVTVIRDKLQIWDVATGKSLGETLTHGDKIQSATFSPDGSKILTEGEDNSVRLWDAATAKPLGEPLRHQNFVFHATFSPDGRKLVTAIWDKTAQVWDVASGTALGESLNHEDRIYGITFSPDGSKIVTFSADGTARVWDANTGKPLGEPLRHEGAVWTAVFSPDGSKIVTASDDKTARVWDAPIGGSDMIKNSRLDKNSTTENAEVWVVTVDKPLGDPLRHMGEVTSASFSPDGTKIITTSKDKTARLWDAATGKPLGEPLPHTFYVSSAAFSPDGTKVVTASEDYTARIWDVATGRPLGEPLRHAGEVNTASFSPDGSKIITSSRDFTARIWDSRTGKPLGEPMQHEEKVLSAAFSPDGTKILTASVDATARIWDATNGRQMGEPMRQEDPVHSATFSPDGKWIVTASSDIARVWDVQTHKAVGEPMRHALPIESAAFSPDGTKIVTASEDHTARVWDAATGKPLGEPLQHESAVNSAMFSPDGSKILTRCADNAVRVWDAITGQLLGEPLRHQSAINSAAFSPDGGTILTSSDDKTARLWYVKTMLHPSLPVPVWMRDWARAVAGQRFNADGVMQIVPAEERMNILQSAHVGIDMWSRLAQWLATEPAQRTTHPDSIHTCRAVAEQERDSGDWEGLESAIKYDPTVPLARLLFARELLKNDHFGALRSADPSLPMYATFLCDYDLKRLPDDPALWVRAVKALHDQEDNIRTGLALKKLDALAPGEAKALRAELGF